MYGLTGTLKDRPTHAVWDLVSGLLYQFHSAGIEEGEEPAPEGEAALHVGNEFEQALEPGVLAPPERFTAYFDNLRDAEHALRAIEPVLKHLSPVFDIHEMEEKNYAELYRENFHPIEAAPFWRVRASWHEAEKNPPANRIELVVEPGMAFGTGSHETTKGCLELLARAAKSTTGADARSGSAGNVALAGAGSLGSASRVLDFGCGSGILAIALKKLGAGTVYGIDIDPLAIEASHQNAAANGVSIDIGLEAREYTDLDGIVANILKNTLLEFAPSFQRWLKPGGFLILSGLLAEQEREILQHYERLGFACTARLPSNDWVSLWLCKKPPSQVVLSP